MCDSLGQLAAAQWLPVAYRAGDPLEPSSMPCRAAAARQASADSSTTFGDASLAPSCCPLTLTLLARCPCRPLGNWRPEPRASAIFDQRCVSRVARTRVGCVPLSGRTLRAVKCRALAWASNKSCVRRSAVSKTFSTGPLSGAPACVVRRGARFPPGGGGCYLWLDARFARCKRLCNDTSRNTCCVKCRPTDIRRAPSALSSAASDGLHVRC